MAYISVERRWGSPILIVAIALALTAAIKRPIKKPTYDPTAETVELFNGIEQGYFEATLIPKSAHEGNVFIENKTGKPLSVKLPPAVAAVQVLKQGFGPGTGNAPPGGGTGLGNAGNNQNGQAQSLGGGFGGGGLGGGGLGGGGIFSIPPEKTVQVPFKSVCLAYGRPDPKPQMTYKLVQLDSYTKDPVLTESLQMFAAGEVSQAAMQATAWHLANGLSWDQLASKQIAFLGGLPSKPYFSSDQIATAKQLVSAAEKRLVDRPEKKL